MEKLRSINTIVGNMYGSYRVLRRDTENLVKNNTLWICYCTTCNSERTMYYANLNRITKCTCQYQNKEHILNALYTQTKNSAERRNIKFDLNKEDLLDLLSQQKFKCALSGIKLKIGRYHQGKETTASIDRIDSSKSYNINNIQWVHKDINKMKNIISNDDFVYYCNKVSEHYYGN